MPAAKKLPAMQFYTGDWKKDPCIGACSATTRGIWIELLMAMHEDDRCGFVSGTVTRLSRLARCDSSEMIEAIYELEETGAAEVEIEGDSLERHANVTVKNRRMFRDWSERKSAADRQKRLRKKSSRSDVTVMSRECHGDVTKKSRPLSSSSSSISSSPSEEETCSSGDEPPSPEYTKFFSAFWENYPRKSGKRKASEEYDRAVGRIVRARGLDRVAAHEWLAQVALEFSQSPKGRAGKFCPMAQTWLSQGRYDDDRQEWQDGGNDRTTADAGKRHGVRSW